MPQPQNLQTQWTVLSFTKYDTLPQIRSIPQVDINLVFDTVYAWRNDSLGLSLCVLLVVSGLMVFGVASDNTLTELDGDWTLPQSKHTQSRIWYCGCFLPQTNHRNIDSIYTRLSLVVYTQSKLIWVWKWLRWCLSSLQAYPSLKGDVDCPKHLHSPK